MNTAAPGAGQGDGDEAQQEFIRLSVLINDDTAATLQDLSSRKRISVDEVIRRAVSVLYFIENEIAAGKTVIRLVDRGGYITDP